MTRRRHSYALQVLREDGSSAGQVPVQVDWEPAMESLRFRALLEGRAPAEALALDCAIEPLWHGKQGAPYLAGFRACTGAGDSESAGVWQDFTTAYFSRYWRPASARLVEKGVLKEGERFHCRPVAFPSDDAAARERLPRLLRLDARAAAPAVPIRQGRLGDLLERSAPSGCRVKGDIAVFVPRTVLDEASAIATAAEAKETGGILVGHLHRDTETAEVFAQVTAQIPARHADADLARLSFTAEVWTDVRAALALRRLGEIMLGWWHSHPVREWCRSCSEESRRRCPLAADFFSDHDRTLHRTVFPRAYSLGLVVNDVVANAPTFSLFGWRHGLIEPRGFRILEPQTDVAAETPSALPSDRRPEDHAEPALAHPRTRRDPGRRDGSASCTDAEGVACPSGGIDAGSPETASLASGEEKTHDG